MATMAVLRMLGFERTKVGSGEKEVGYKISEHSIGGVVRASFLGMVCLALLVLVMMYDVRIYKKTVTKKVRQAEHKAAASLTQAHMQLWAEYRENIQESREAAALLQRLDKAHEEFMTSFGEMTFKLQSQFKLDPAVSADIAASYLSVLEQFHAGTYKRTQALLNHLTDGGKRSVPREKAAHTQIHQDLEDEVRSMGEFGEIFGEADEATITGILHKFFHTFHDHQREFSGEVREHFLAEGPVYHQVQAVSARMYNDESVTELELMDMLRKIDLAGLGAPLGEGRRLPVHAVIEELSLIHVIPVEEIAKLEKDWQAGKLDAMQVMMSVFQMHEQALVPSGWIDYAALEEPDEHEEEHAEEEDHAHAHPGLKLKHAGEAAHEHDGK